MDLPIIIERAIPFVIGFAVVIGLSALSFWKQKGILFQLTGAISMMLGLEYRHYFPGQLSLSISLIMIAYWLVCWGFAYLYLARFDTEHE